MKTLNNRYMQSLLLGVAALSLLSAELMPKTCVTSIIRSNAAYANLETHGRGGTGDGCAGASRIALNSRT